MVETTTTLSDRVPGVIQGGGFVADDYVGSFMQWCAENPCASARDVQHIALFLLRVADREAERHHRRGRS